MLKFVFKSKNGSSIHGGEVDGIREPENKIRSVSGGQE